MKGYNTSVHNATGIAPKNVNMYNDGKVWKKLFSNKLYGSTKKKKSRRHKLNVGDKVMLSKVRRTFKKGYLPGWTEEIFVEDRKLDTYVPSYKIKEYDGTPVKGTFYEEELQKVDMSDEDTFFRIDKVLKKRDGKVLVSWKGWPAKYNSWREERDVVDFTKKKKNE